VGDAKSIPLADPPSGTSEPPEPPSKLRLIYLDPDRATAYMQRLAASAEARKVLSPVKIGSGGTIGDHNVAFLMEQIARTSGQYDAFDLGHGSDVALNDHELHPGQLLVLSGRVSAVTDVVPSSLLLSMPTGSMRVLVDKEHGLHLNRQYLAEREVRAIGIVHSVPRTQLRAVAVFTARRSSPAPSARNDRGG
jgi:hypothetical protein